MSSVFYDHLITIHDLHVEFDRLEIPVLERGELMRLADSTVHHEVFDLLMIEIPEQHHKEFLEKFSEDPGDPSLLTFIKEKSPGIEDKIKNRIEKVKQDLLKETKKP